MADVIWNDLTINEKGTKVVGIISHSNTFKLNSSNDNNVFFTESNSFEPVHIPS